jgi:hypothetical protein
VLPDPLLSVLIVLEVKALLFPLGFTTSNVTEYAVFRNPAVMVKLRVTLFPRQSGVVGVIDKLYGGIAATVGLLVIATASARMMNPILARNVIST